MCLATVVPHGTSPAAVELAIRANLHGVASDVILAIVVIAAKSTVRPMDALVKRLDKKLRDWNPETATRVRSQVTEIIELADHELLDLVRPRKVEQEVLDLLDEPKTR
ncbi:MAG TPA: hypothetical protein VGX78_15915 [Pirellulales bacterium]|jgi:hypothetical protein|nr:hypothetical protein [Pirellulales bacterium]